MASVFMSMEKLKGDEVTKSYQHNLRINNCVETADPSLTYLNREYIALKENDYQAEVDKEINNAIANGTMKSVRSDAVKGIEIIFNFPDSEEKNVDLDLWAEKNKEWLIGVFGEKNVKHMILHLDEPHIDEENPENSKANAHIHAFIVPMDKNGRLNCKSFLNGPGHMKMLQQDYYEKVAKGFGFQPPMNNTPKRKAKMHNFYSVMANCNVVSEQEKIKMDNVLNPQETEITKDGVTKEYVERIRKEIPIIYEEAIGNAKMAAKKEISKAQNQSMKSSNIYYNKVRELEIQKKEDEEFLDKLLGDLQSSHMTSKEARNALKNMDCLQRGLDNLEDQEYAKRLRQEIADVISGQHKKDKKAKKEWTKEKDIDRDN